LADAGVDFIWIDGSNNVFYDPSTMHDQRPDFAMIEDSTTLIFEEYAKLSEQGKPHPKVSIFLGAPGHPEAITDGTLQKKVDQVHDAYVDNPRFRAIIQDYQGRPLLVIYVGTPSPFQQGVPSYDDSRFTVRWMTGFVSEQGNLVTGQRESRYNYWSWEDRGPQTFTTHAGKPEAMIVLAAWRKQGEPANANYIPERGRRDGETFRQEWERARAIGPKFAMVGTWNEWVTGEQPSAEISKEIEPADEFGHFYLHLLKKEVARFKGKPFRTEDINLDRSLNAIDIQLVINAALGVTINPFEGDVNADSEVNAVDVQRVINAVLGV